MLDETEKRKSISTFASVRAKVYPLDPTQLYFTHHPKYGTLYNTKDILGDPWKRFRGRSDCIHLPMNLQQGKKNNVVFNERSANSRWHPLVLHSFYHLFNVARNCYPNRL